MGFDHFHPSTTAELTCFRCFFFETGFVIKKPESLTYWLQIIQIKANAGYAASKMKRNEDPSGAGEDRRVPRPMLQSLDGTSGASARGKPVQKHDKELRLVRQLTKKAALFLNDQTERAICIAQILFTFQSISLKLCLMNNVCSVW